MTPWRECSGCGFERNCGIHGCAIIHEALKRLAAEEANEPLTPEQLRWMDGNPVWIVRSGRPGCWDLIRRKTTSGISVYVHGFLAWSTCGKSWTAYRRPLEEKEETHDA